MTKTSEAWEPRARLLQAAGDAGFKLSDPQLGRLHRAGLIPSPHTRSLGRGKGTVSEFPAGSTARLLRVLGAQKATRAKKLSTVAWHLWWEDGGSLPTAGRDILTEVAARWDHGREELSSLLDREDEADADAVAQMEALYREAEHSRLEGPLGTARRNAGREGFASVVRVLAEIGTGRFESYDAEDPADDGTPSPGSTGALVEKALRIDRARSDRIAGNEPRFDGSSEADLARLSQMVGRRRLEPLGTAPDAELDAARTELRGLFAFIMTFAPFIERTVGRDASGFGTIGRLLNPRTPRLQAFMLLAWLVLREDVDFPRFGRHVRALIPDLLFLY